MWDSIKRFFTIPKQSKRDALETAFLAQSKVIADTMRRQQELLAQQQVTLDRIVTAKYDRPVFAPPAVIPADQMPEWALNDQGEVRPGEMDAGLDSLTVDSDQAFLDSVGGK